MRRADARGREPGTMAQAGRAETGDEIEPWLDRRVAAWATYDVASSAYYGVVPPSLFPIFYLTGVATGGGGFLSWGATVSLALIFAGCLAPIVGRMADRNGWHWPLLATTTPIYCLATAALSLVNQGEAAFALAVEQQQRGLFSALHETGMPCAGHRQSNKSHAFFLKRAFHFLDAGNRPGDH